MFKKHALKMEECSNEPSTSVNYVVRPMRTKTTEAVKDNPGAEGVTLVNEKKMEFSTNIENCFLATCISYKAGIPFFPLLLVML